MNKRCKHEPEFQIAAFLHTCKHCGEGIEAVTCPKCEGTGVNEEARDDCAACKGTGTKKWRKV